MLKHYFIFRAPVTHAREVGTVMNTIDNDLSRDSNTLPVCRWLHSIWVRIICSNTVQCYVYERCVRIQSLPYLIYTHCYKKQLVNKAPLPTAFPVRRVTSSSCYLLVVPSHRCIIPSSCHLLVLSPACLNLSPSCTLLTHTHFRIMLFHCTFAKLKILDVSVYPSHEDSPDPNQLVTRTLIWGRYHISMAHLADRRKHGLSLWTLSSSVSTAEFAKNVTESSAPVHVPSTPLQIQLQTWWRMRCKAAQTQTSFLKPTVASLVTGKQVTL